MNFIKNFFVEMLKASPLMHWPCAAADDKKAPPARIFTGPASGLINRGDVGTTRFKNFLYSIALPYADSISGKIFLDGIFSRTSPVGDTDWESLPIGAFCVHIPVTATVVTDCKLYLKTASGYEKILTSLDADWFDLITVTDIVTAGAVTWTSAQIEGGLITRDCAAADRSDVTPTAALIVAGIDSAVVGSAVRMQVKNVSDADEVLTVTAGAGVTLAPTVVTVKPKTTKELLFVCTNITSGTEAVTCYDMDQLLGDLVKTITTDVTAGANTWTAAELLKGVLLRDPTGGDRSDVLPTAALLVAAAPDAWVGQTFEFTMINNSDADEVITVTAGVGCTLAPTSITLGRNQAKKFVALLTNVTAAAEAYTVYELGLGFANVNVREFTKKTVVTDLGGGAQTASAAELIGGYMQNDPAGDVNVTTATATQIVAAIPNCQVGSSFECVLENTANGAETITIVGGADVTLTAGQTFTPTQNESLRMLFVVTGVGTPGVTVYGLGEFTS